MDVSRIEYDVIWPHSRDDYLTIEEPVRLSVATPVGDDPSPARPAAPSGRELAARALLGAGCTQARAGALLGVSRRTVGRTADRDVSAALRQAETLTRARGCLVESERRGSTAEERDAALDWLGHALREQQGARPPADHPDSPAVFAGPMGEASPPAPARAEPTASSQAASAPRVSHRGPGRVIRGRPRSTSTTARSASVSRPRQKPSPSPASASGLALEQVHALTEQQQRILHRSVVLEWALHAETLDSSTLREAFTDLLADITTSARAIATILQQATR